MSEPCDALLRQHTTGWLLTKLMADEQHDRFFIVCNRYKSHHSPLMQPLQLELMASKYL